MFRILRVVKVVKCLNSNIERCRLHSMQRSTFHSSSVVGSDKEWANFGTWEDRIEEPILMQQSIKHGIPIPRISLEHAGPASLVGRRKVNEDRILLKELATNVLCYGIFDGHAGSLAADFTVQHLTGLLRDYMEEEHDLQKVLSAAFLEVNDRLEAHIDGELSEPERADVRNTGTTATVCLLRNGNELVIGHVGDSRAILCRDGQPKRLTVDHDPGYNESENERIHEANGFITSNSLGTPLVNGVLTMTRSIGDFSLKRYGVIASPETSSIKVKHGRDSFLLLITDGVHFSMSDGEICHTISRCHTPLEAANTITDQAIQYGSHDNASAIVVPLGQWGKESSSTFIPALRWEGREG